MSNKIWVVTEGPTEREVGQVLIKKKILTPLPTGYEYKLMPKGKTAREGQDTILNNLLDKKGRAGWLASGKEWQNVFMMFDQEMLDTAQDRAKAVINHFQSYGQRNNDSFWTDFFLEPHETYANVFIHISEQFRMVLHVADVAGPNGNKDFDGYILKLLQSSAGEDIAQRLVNQELAQKLLHKGNHEIPELMTQNGYPLKYNKSWLYAHITAFQYGQSHVWFARDVVKAASMSSLRTTFASLITAWETLKEAISA